MENKPDQPAKSLVEQEAERLYPITEDSISAWLQQQAYIAGSKSRGGPQWVKATERLPDKDGEYICKSSLGVRIVCDFENGQWDGDLRGDHGDPETIIEWLDEGESHPSGKAAEDGWVSVKELPDEKVFVLLYHPLRDLFKQGYWYQGKWIIAGTFDKFEKDEFTHWRPLPSPPQTIKP